MSKSPETSPEDILSILNSNQERAIEIEDKIQEHYKDYMKEVGDPIGGIFGLMFLFKHKSEDEIISECGYIVGGDESIARALIRFRKSNLGF